MDDQAQNQRPLAPQDEQAAKMAAMSKLAAGVAHEINNPCGVLLMKLKFLLSIADDERLSRRATSTLQVAIEQTERIESIVESLVRFSRPTQSMPRPVHLNEAIEGALAVTPRPDSVSLDRLLEDSLPEVEADPEQLQQVFAAILSNAVDAMPDGGTLTVRSQRRVMASTSEDSAPATEESVVGTTQLVVEITDTGSGIPVDFIDRIFDPFFTTKVVGKGTGLGLAISYGIVQRLGGQIDVQSERGVGTQIRVTLPVRSAA